MARKRTITAAGNPPVTVAEVIRVLEGIERQCRYARLLLKGIDRKTPVKLSRESKAMMKELSAQPIGLINC